MELLVCELAGSPEGRVRRRQKKTRQVSGRRHLGAHLRAQIVDQGQALRRFEMPEGPAVAGIEPLRQRSNLVDRADTLANRYRAVGTHQRLVPFLGVDQIRAW